MITSDAHVEQPQSDEGGSKGVPGDTGDPGDFVRDKPKKESPATVQAFVEFAYSRGGQKISLPRKDVAAIPVSPDTLEQEVAAIRQLSVQDRWLAVPPAILIAVAELTEPGPLRRRLVELVQVALKMHPLFAGQRGGPFDAGAENVITARDLSDGASRLNAAMLGLDADEDLKPPLRDRLRVNAVTASGLVRVLRDGWRPEQFAEDMAALVWTKPYGRGPRAAALLASARNTDALAQLCRQFELALRERRREIDEERASVQKQVLRALTAERESQALGERLAEVDRRCQALRAEVHDLTQRLGVEQSSRVVDKSHLVDDYELLRTQVLRRLTKQVTLLGDGLHALRNGSPDVAEEFVDRALVAITSEVARLKDAEGGGAP